MKLVVYIAGPLFTPAERLYLEAMANEFEAAGFLTYLPHRDGGLAGADKANTSSFFKSDISGIDKASIVVAVLNGKEVDSGTAFEVGYAYAKGKALFGIYEDTRIADPQTHINLMLTNSTSIFNNRNELLKAVCAFERGPSPG